MEEKGEEANEEKTISLLYTLYIYFYMLEMKTKYSFTISFVLFIYENIFSFFDWNGLTLWFMFGNDK